MNIAIIDDESFYRHRIKDIVNDYLNTYQISSQIELFSSGETFAALEVAMAKYQIIFIDINMNGLDGLKIPELSRTYNKDNLDKLLMECMDGILKELKFQLKTITVKFIDIKEPFPWIKYFI